MSVPEKVNMAYIKIDESRQKKSLPNSLSKVEVSKSRLPLIHLGESKLGSNAVRSGEKWWWVISRMRHSETMMILVFTSESFWRLQHQVSLVHQKYSMKDSSVLSTSQQPICSLDPQWGSCSSSRWSSLLTDFISRNWGGGNWYGNAGSLDSEDWLGFLVHESSPGRHTLADVTFGRFDTQSD